MEKNAVPNPAVTAVVHQTLAFWSSRWLHTLRLRRDALEVFVFSKLWYLAQALPMPAQAAQHLAYWLGPALGNSFPDLVRPQHAASCPPLLAALAPLLEELTTFGTVEAAHPAVVTAKGIYMAFTDTLPPPKV